MEEIWKRIDLGAGFYEVSSFGKIRNVQTGLLVGYVGYGGYVVFTPPRQPSCKKRVHRYVHRIVAEAFIPRVAGKPFINHKNFDRTDNRVCNLEWVTAQENIQHCSRNGRLYVAFNNKSAKATFAIAQEIRSLSASGHSGRLIAKRFGISHQSVCSILQNKSYNPATHPDAQAASVQL